MNELNVFVSYRRSDGDTLALWLRNSLHGRFFSIRCGARVESVTLSVYVDQKVPAAPDWRELLKRELAAAKVLIVNCTPDACSEKAENDWLQFELKWWMENRECAPILVAPVNFGRRFVPEVVRKKWPATEVVLIDDPANDSDNIEDTQEDKVSRILTGIGLRLQGSQTNTNSNLEIEVPGLYWWQKDRQLRYIGCNENYARAAGFDSPSSVIGKTDDDMPWRDLADFFREGDFGVIRGKGPSRFNVQEKEIMVDRTADILVNESQLLDRRGECIGVVGCFVDITGKKLVENPQAIIRPDNSVVLGDALGRQELTGAEASVLLEMLRGLASGQIAEIMSVRKNEIEAHIDSIRRKLQCATLGDVIATATCAGAQFQTLEPQLLPNEDAEK
jgi:DNA-binding CsgD family transcriptional regulator